VQINKTELNVIGLLKLFLKKHVGDVDFVPMFHFLYVTGIWITSIALKLNFVSVQTEIVL
jgi:hypothetical protein